MKERLSDFGFLHHCPPKRDSIRLSTRHMVVLFSYMFDVTFVNCKILSYHVRMEGNNLTIWTAYAEYF